MLPIDETSRGPYPVGALQTEILSKNDPLTEAGGPPRTLPCEIWYPADPAWNPQAENEGVEHDAPHPLGLPHLATVGAPPLATPCPLIAFSHGNSGLRQQSTFLTTHLASWGFIVVAPDHVGNTYAEMLTLDSEEARQEVHLRARAQRPHDLADVLRALVDEGHAEADRPPVANGPIGVLGHSYGGWTALKSARLDDRIQSICCLAPASEPFVGRKAFEVDELPLAPETHALVVAGAEDVLVDLASSINPLFARLGAGATLEVLDGADHFHFCDGIELLHKMHENTPRPNQSRPTQPFSALRGESETHGWLNARVASFFRSTLARNAGTDTTQNPEALIPIEGATP